MGGFYKFLSSDAVTSKKIVTMTERDPIYQPNFLTADYYTDPHPIEHADFFYNCFLTTDYLSLTNQPLTLQIVSGGQ